MNNLTSAMRFQLHSTRNLQNNFQVVTKNLYRAQDYLINNGFNGTKASSYQTNSIISPEFFELKGSLLNEGKFINLQSMPDEINKSLSAIKNLKGTSYVRDDDFELAISEIVSIRDVLIAKNNNLTTLTYLCATFLGAFEELQDVQFAYNYNELFDENNSHHRAIKIINNKATDTFDKLRSIKGSTSYEYSNALDIFDIFCIENDRETLHAMEETIISSLDLFMKYFNEIREDLNAKIIDNMVALAQEIEVLRLIELEY